MLMTRGAVAGNVILVVGPGQTYPSVSSAVVKADGDTNAANYYTIEVHSENLYERFPTVTRPMTIESRVVGQPVVLNATSMPRPTRKALSSICRI